MANIPVPQAKYALLNDNKSKNIWRCKSRFAFSVIILLILLAFFAILYYVLRGTIYNKTVLPVPIFGKDIPQSWLYRAIAYNDLDKATINKTNPIAVRHFPKKSTRDFKLVCYYTFPNNNNQSNWVLNESNIDPNLCTHLILGFAGIVNNSIYFGEEQMRVAQQVINLKHKNKLLKVMLSVGGAGDDAGFPEMVMNHANRKVFIQSINKAVKEIGFDGIDLDWEFPNVGENGDKRQRMHFTQLLHEIREEINRQQEEKQYLLSVAVAAPVFLVDDCYDVGYMNSYVDFINLMSYDYHFYTKFTPFTGLNAPLFNRKVENGYFGTLNINYSASYWFSKGMDKSKIVVGLPTYGHSFKLINIDNNGIGAPAAGYGALGTNGFIDYADVCWFLQKNNINQNFDLESKSPYAFYKHEWISFDNEQSLTYKAEFIKSQNYGGAMVLSLNTDDHKGACKNSFNRHSVNVTFPLTRKIKSILKDDQL